MQNFHRLIFFLSVFVTVTFAQGCRDTDRECKAWAEHGHCVPNTYVFNNCQRACGRCGNPPASFGGSPGNRQGTNSQNSVTNDNQFHGNRGTNPESCVDLDRNCIAWAQGGLCRQGSYVGINCRSACNFCTSFKTSTADVAKYDPANLSADLRPLGFLLGKWREEFRGKAVFPTMPTFSYGEEVDFSIAERTPRGFPALNYSAHAWGLNTQEELHSENGFLTALNWRGSLNTVMSNGFSAIEEADLDESNSVQFFSTDIDRVTFSRDLPVRSMRRKFRLIGTGQHLEQIFEMATITHPMALHARVIYRKVFP